MRYRCPICSFEFIGGGFCPSPYHVATMMEELPEQEDNREIEEAEDGEYIKYEDHLKAIAEAKK